MWGDESLEFHRCRACGCVTHWSPTNAERQKMGINARLLPAAVLAAIPVTHGDGASR